MVAHVRRCGRQLGRVVPGRFARPVDRNLGGNPARRSAFGPLGGLEGRSPCFSAAAKSCGPGGTAGGAWAVWLQWDSRDSAPVRARCGNPGRISLPGWRWRSLHPNWRPSWRRWHGEEASRQARLAGAASRSGPVARGAGANRFRTTGDSAADVACLRRILIRPLSRRWSKRSAAWVPPPVSAGSVGVPAASAGQMLAVSPAAAWRRGLCGAASRWAAAHQAARWLSCTDGEAGQALGFGTIVSRGG